MLLSLPIILFYGFVHPGRIVEHDGTKEQLAAGWQTLAYVLHHAVLNDYVPFIVLLASLYTISGGIELRGDLRATPRVNTAFLAAGALLASFIGTTGAAMLLIRPLLSTNAERKHIRHTIVVLHIHRCATSAAACCRSATRRCSWATSAACRSCGRCTWQRSGAVANVVLLAIYFVWDTLAYHRETVVARVRDTVEVELLNLRGHVNLLYLLGVVLSVGLLVPGKPVPGLPGFITPVYLREAVMLALAGLSLRTTPRGCPHSQPV